MYKTHILILLLVAFFASGCAVKVDPMNAARRHKFIQEDKELRQKHLIPISGKLTLAEAMARTIVANIDYQIKKMEQAVTMGEFKNAKMEMLPELRGTASYTFRDPQSASKSMNLETGQVSTGGYTTSESRSRYLGDLTFSWNILDFGLSYYQAKQQADSVLVRQEMQRKALQNLLFKVRHAYWKAYSAQEFRGQVRAILAKSKKALARSLEMENRRLRPILDTLRYQRALHEVINQLEALRMDMELAEIELLNLMNVPYETKVVLVAPRDPDVAFGQTQFPPIADMIEVALHQRPECRQAMYRSRASLLEVKKAVLKTLPGLEIKSAFNFDTNEFIRDNSWFDVWGNLTGDIVEMLTAPQRIDIAERSVDLAKYRRLGTHLAVISQVQMSLRQYTEALQADARARELSRIDARMASLLRNSVNSSAGNPLEAIRQDAAALFSRLSQYQRYAEVHETCGRVLASMGVDIIPFEATQTRNIEELKSMLSPLEGLIDIAVVTEKFKAALEQELAEQTDD